MNCYVLISIYKLLFKLIECWLAGGHVIERSEVDVLHLSVDIEYFVS